MIWEYIPNELRVNKWHRVNLPEGARVARTATEWCMTRPSTGGYFSHTALVNGKIQSDWWFENESDALMFVLRWSTK